MEITLGYTYNIFLYVYGPCVCNKDILLLLLLYRWHATTEKKKKKKHIAGMQLPKNAACRCICSMCV